MKKENNQNVIIGVLGTLVLVVAILVILTINGTISFANNSNNNNLSEEINQTIKENGDKKDYDQSSVLLDKDKVEKYKNADGTYGTQKSVFETDYNAHLSLIGEVEVCYQSDCHKINNIDNVVDMIKWTVAGAGEENQKILFLLDNGDLYSYTYKDINNNKFDAKKIENINNVDRIVEFSYSPLGKGGNWGAIAITNNNEYIEIYRESI